MFGSTNPFGQSSSSPFGSLSVFWQTNGAANNPFAPRPFGNPNLFSSQSGLSAFGVSIGVFGQPSTPAFWASSTPAFGNSMPSFGASSTPTFGSSSSPFGAFEGFGSTFSQSSPFGSSFQQTQPAFGSNLFGTSSPFGASSQPAFGVTSAPAFGATSAFETPLFGNTGMAFRASSTEAFGAPSTSLFGSSTSPAFGGSSTPAFGSSSSPAFGGLSTSSFSFNSAPSFGTQSSPFGAQIPTPKFGSPGFGQSNFGSQAGGSRVAPYNATPEPDASGTQPAGKLVSISAMPIYKDKSFEELRLEDYQRGDKGVPNPAGRSAQANPFGQTSRPFGRTRVFGQAAANPFSSATFPNPFAPKTSAPGSSSSACYEQHSCQLHVICVLIIK